MGTNVGEIGNYYGTSLGNVGWPECGEIDIMEQNGPTNKFYTEHFIGQIVVDKLHHMD